MQVSSLQVIGISEVLAEDADSCIIRAVFDLLCVPQREKTWPCGLGYLGEVFIAFEYV